MRSRSLGLVGLVLCAGMLILAGSAGAAESRLPLGPFGSFTGPKGLAVDQGSHDVYAIGGRSEVQTVTVVASAGQFKLNFGAQTTNDLPFNASETEVENALRNSICGGSPCVFVKGGPGNATGSEPYVVTFQEEFATSDVEQLECVPGTPPLSGSCTVETTTPGVNGTITRYDAKGNPSEFSALGSNAIDGLGGPDLTPQIGLHFVNSAARVQVAVDESGGATDGDIYVPQRADQAVDVFSSSGEYLGQLSEYEETPGNPATLTPLGLPCGAAVDAGGNVYVGDVSSGIHKYTPTGKVVANADSVANFSAVASPCALAAGRGATAGSIFAVNVFSEGLFKLDATTGALKYEFSEGNTTITVDPTSGHVLAAGGKEIKEWDASGAAGATLLGSIPTASPPTGVGVDGTTGKGGTLYVAREGASSLDVYSPLVQLPAVVSKAATNITTTTAILNGTISAEGGSEAKCHFQYIDEASFQAQKKAAQEAGGKTSSEIADAAFAGAKSAPCEPAGPFAGSEVNAVSAKTTALSPETKYEFRIVGENESKGSQIAGAELSFETNGKPLIEGAGASEVSTSSALISATVNPRGFDTTTTVEYVTREQFEASGFEGASVVEGPSVPKLVSGAGDLNAATGSGDLAKGFNQVVNLKTENGTFAVGQAISGAGIKAGTTITALGAETLTLSQPAEASGAKVALIAGSKVITNLTTSAGNFAAGQTIEGAGIPTGTTIVSASASELVLSAPVSAAGKGVVLSAAGPQPVAVELTGLDPDTAYVFRVVAENEAGTGQGKAVGFATRTPLGGALADGRVWELVSPPVRMGGVYPPEPSKFGGGNCKFCTPGWNSPKAPMQSSPDGGAVAFEGDPFFAGLAAEANSYVARRGAGGWQTAALSTPQLNEQVFKAFSPDLSKAIMLQIEPSLSPEAPEDFANLYLREEGKSLVTLITGEPPNRSPGFKGENPFQITYAGANAGTGAVPAFSHVIFEANDALTGAVEEVAPAAPTVGAEETNLYEWSGGELHLLNVRPGNEEAAPNAVIGSGLLLAVGTESFNFDHAISDDGTRIFWSEQPSGQVYVREGGVSTTKIPDPGKFLTATPDGAKVLLSDGCLYDLEAEGCEDLTADQSHVHQGGFQGMAGASEDLSRIYFVDTAVLSGEENGNEEVAEGGKFNLYLWEEGAVSFIGRLAAGDNELGDFLQIGGWRAAPGNRLAQATNDGRYLSFESTAQLTGFESTVQGAALGVKSCVPADPNRAIQCTEVFSYDAATHTLTCPSCNPSGERPLGGSNLSLIINPSDGKTFPQPDNLPPAGEGRLYFESRDTLTQGDTNGRIQDVYEFEPAGVGDCTRAQGCLSLISSGHGPKDSQFINASATGNDVFFTTTDQLLGVDKNDFMDIYDARVGGGIAEEAPAPCAGEACAGPLQPPPVFPAPSSTQVGPEAPAPKPKCKRGFVRKANRCVRRHKAHHRHHRAAKSRGARR